MSLSKDKYINTIWDRFPPQNSKTHPIAYLFFFLLSSLCIYLIASLDLVKSFCISIVLKNKNKISLLSRIFSKSEFTTFYNYKIKCSRNLCVVSPILYPSFYILTLFIFIFHNYGPSTTLLRLPFHNFKNNSRFSRGKNGRWEVGENNRLKKMSVRFLRVRLWIYSWLLNGSDLFN